MNRSLTKRQNEILTFIKSFLADNGYPPSVREIATAVGLASPSTVHAHLKALEDHGYIKRDPTKPRALVIYNDDGSAVTPEIDEPEKLPHSSISVPLVGRVAAGMPILAEQNIEDKFILPRQFVDDDNTFILEVHGNSMINVGIYNGDFILVREQQSADNGDIIVAMIDNEATVKTFYKEKGRVRLQPENDTMEPIYAANPVILGKVIALMRRFM